MLYGTTESKYSWKPGSHNHCNYVMGVSATFRIVYSVGKYSLPSATKLRRLCFHRRVSVHRGGAWSGGLPGLGGALSWGCLVLGVPGPGGARGPGGCLVLGGVCSRGGWYPSMH